MDIIQIIFNDQDVRDMAEEFEIPTELALKRAVAWASSIQDTAMTLCVTQLEDCIRHDQP